LGQFHQRLLATDGGERHFCLESRAVVPARSSRHSLSCSRHLSRSQAEIPLILAVQISRTTSLPEDTTAEADFKLLAKVLWRTGDQFYIHHGCSSWRCTKR